MQLRLKGYEIPQHLVRFFRPVGHMPKDLVNIPHLLAEALREDGWWLRSEMTACKVAPMPESVTDRPTSATEKVFLFAKSERYYYDNIAVAEPAIHEGRVVKAYKQGAKNLDGATDANDRRTAAGFGNHDTLVTTRNMRNWFLWQPEPFPGAHFAVFPRRIPEIAILAGSSAKGACARCGSPWQRVVERSGQRESHGVNKVADLMHSTEPIRQHGGRHGVSSVFATGKINMTDTTGWTPTCTCDCLDVVPCVIMDPFAGSGTTLEVAQSLGRHAIGIDLNAEYCKLAVDRLPQQAMVLDV